MARFFSCTRGGRTSQLILRPNFFLELIRKWAIPDDEVLLPKAMSECPLRLLLPLEFPLVKLERRRIMLLDLTMVLPRLMGEKGLRADFGSC